MVEYVIGKDLMPWQAFEVLWAVIDTKGWKEHTKMLVQWLMVMGTCYTPTDPLHTMLDQLGKGPVGTTNDYQ
jgi:hypothetical protein